MKLVAKCINNEELKMISGDNKFFEKGKTYIVGDAMKQEDTVLGVLFENGKDSAICEYDEKNFLLLFALEKYDYVPSLLIKLKGTDNLDAQEKFVVTEFLRGNIDDVNPAWTFNNRGDCVNKSISEFRGEKILAKYNLCGIKETKVEESTIGLTEENKLQDLQQKDDLDYLLDVNFSEFVHNKYKLLTLVEGDLYSTVNQSSLSQDDKDHIFALLKADEYFMNYDINEQVSALDKIIMYAAAVDDALNGEQYLELLNIFNVCMNERIFAYTKFYKEYEKQNNVKFPLFVVQRWAYSLWLRKDKDINTSWEEFTKIINSNCDEEIPSVYTMASIMYNHYNDEDDELDDEDDDDELDDDDEDDDGDRAYLPLYNDNSFINISGCEIYKPVLEVDRVNQSLPPLKEINYDEFENTCVSILNSGRLSPFQVVRIKSEFASEFTDQQFVKDVGVIECVCLGVCRVLFKNGASLWLPEEYLRPYIDERVSFYNINDIKTIYNTLKSHQLSAIKKIIDEYQDPDHIPELYGISIYAIKYISSLYHNIQSFVSGIGKDKLNVDMMNAVCGHCVHYITGRMDDLWCWAKGPDNPRETTLTELLENGLQDSRNFYLEILRYSVAKEPQLLIKYIATALRDIESLRTHVIDITIMAMSIYMDINDVISVFIKNRES